MTTAPAWIEPDPAFSHHDGGADPAVVALLAAGDGIAAIERAAARHPDKPAVVDDAVTLTYAELLDRSYGLAADLIARFPAGAVLASLVGNSAATPVIVLAAAIAGVVLVPIDATHPRERQEAIFAQAGAVALLLSASDAGVDNGFVPDTLPRVTVDVRAASGVAAPASRYDAAAPQFVAFTSGSTGRPKGLAASGAYGNQLLAHFTERFGLTDRDTILSLASLSTGGSRDAFLALAAGGTIRICDLAQGFGEVLRIMATTPITVLSFVPSALRMLLEVPGGTAAFRHLRILDLHGERILASDIAFFRERLPGTCRISVTMGSVEAGAIFSWFVDGARIEGATVPVGHLLPGRRVALLDEAGGSVARGEPGELLVRGMMSLGAWREGRIVPGPFLDDPDDPDSRIYPMGDLVRERSDGLFEFVGRKGRQIKVHGLWVDPGEVETALRTIDGVADAAVIAIDNEGERHRLAAFVVVRDGVDRPTRGQMARIVAAETADHMVPAVFQVLPAIPRLANFKPDLVRLEALVPAGRH